MITLVLSMLHEPSDVNSATRLFRGQPVLRWTLDRLARCQKVKGRALLCWDDQLPAVKPIIEAHEVTVLTKGPRHAVPELDRVTAARRWADGWRGGLMSTCDFDAGFHAPWIKEAAARVDATGVVLVPPSSALVDPALIDELISRAAAEADHELIFSQAAPGLSGALVKRGLLDRLAVSRTHPGRLLHYMPDQPMLDPTSSAACVAVPAPIARTTNRFHLDSARQLERISSATVTLNGLLISSAAEDLVGRLVEHTATQPANPREVVLELNTTRSTSPVFAPHTHLPISRADLSVELAKKLFAEIGAVDDVRLTLAGVGDPLLHPHVLTIIAAAKAAGIAAIHVETDLTIADDTVIAGLARSEIDVVSVHLPALTPQMYRAMMGVDAYTQVLKNLTTFVTERARRQSGVPLIVPTFVKCAQNMGEMDAWYDQWIRAVGSAVITGPSNCGGMIPSTAVADMSPPKRRACVRLTSRLVVLSDGTVTTCEEDVLGRQAMGNINSDSLLRLWRSRQARLRQDHEAAQWGRHPICAGCTEWHRP